MAIDAHQHFWYYNTSEYGWISDAMAAIRRDFLPPEYKLLIEATGVDGSVLVQVRQTREETDWLLELAEQNPFILGVVGWVDLQSPNVRAELESYSSKKKLVGIRHVAEVEPDDFLLRPDFLRGVALLNEFGLAYDILIFSKHLPVAAEFVSRFPQQRFVLDHLAKPPIRSGAIDAWARDLRKLASFPNVCAKLSGLTTEADWHNWKREEIWKYLDVAFESFGANRLMIGSDWPVSTLATSFEGAMNLVTSYLSRLTAEERAAVLGGNAARFWRLPRVRGE